MSNVLTAQRSIVLIMLTCNTLLKMHSGPKLFYPMQPKLPAAWVWKCAHAYFDIEKLSSNSFSSPPITITSSIKEVQSVGFVLLSTIYLCCVTTLWGIFFGDKHRISWDLKGHTSFSEMNMEFIVARVLKLYFYKEMKLVFLFVLVPSVWL